MRALLRQVPTHIDTEGILSRRAKMQAWLRHIPDSLPYCDALVTNETPWANTVDFNNDVANALKEINKALGPG